ncbi:ATP-binding protein [Kitasatospora paranensis]|uniref:sensor histidine kinase n=1 Tax=Kitasatospora paranensis TaxID=258053 RepID=UPI0031E4E5FE
MAGFEAAIVLVLTAAGAFVYLRVQYALDLRLNEDLVAQSAQVTADVRAPHQTGLPALVFPGTVYQVIGPGSHVLERSAGSADGSLLHPAELASALRRPLRVDRGALLPISTGRLRLYAVPIAPGSGEPAAAPAVVVVAVRLDQRDEALRELIGQLALANLAALIVASLVGYRLASAALRPVERYRAEAARIAEGATGVRLAVPEAPHDEVTRLGHTLNDMLAALESALERERRFVQDASHELSTPLTLLSAELELAMRRPRTPAQLQATIRAAAADTADLIALTDTLLRVGVQPSGPPTAAVVDLGDLLTGITDRYRATTTAVALGVGPDTEVTVAGDPARLTQVFTNLLDNAVRHGATPVTVNVHATERVAVVSVHDSGPGMDPTFLPHATERFSRADTARTTPGSGLGLSLVETIVRTHHGELRICSNGAHQRINAWTAVECAHPASGTTVTVLLPQSPSG